MLILRPALIKPSEITPEATYLSRRRFLKRAAGLGMGMLGSGYAFADDARSEKPNTWEEITTYNNFYEYSPDKRAVAELATNLKPHPWAISIEGECDAPRTIDVDQLVRQIGTEERIYRFRCVEGWSMVIPWNGIALSAVLALAKPRSSARFVKFTSLHDPVRFYGQRQATLPWPYTEGLTIAEATHPLAFLATGLYGKPLPNQNGAPIRLVVPWKYGFKSIKSIVSIRLEALQPATTWPQVSKDYGFYANVNPHASYGRGSQSRENRIGELRKRDTQLFNGYGADVAHLYAGVDLDKLS